MAKKPKLKEKRGYLIRVWLVSPHGCQADEKLQMVIVGNGFQRESKVTFKGPLKVQHVKYLSENCLLVDVVGDNPGPAGWWCDVTVTRTDPDESSTFPQCFFVDEPEKKSKKSSRK